MLEREDRDRGAQGDRKERERERRIGTEWDMERGERRGEILAQDDPLIALDRSQVWHLARGTAQLLAPF